MSSFSDVLHHQYDQEIVVRTADGGQLTESRAELHRSNLKLIRNCIWHGAHLYKRRSLEERIQRAREGRTTRGSGAQNGHGTIKSRGGYPTGNIAGEKLCYENPVNITMNDGTEKPVWLSRGALLERNYWSIQFLAEGLAQCKAWRDHGVKPVRTTSAGRCKR